MIGTKIYKDNEEQMNNYAEIAIWCNETQTAFIEDKGDYFEVVEIPGPTLDELKKRNIFFYFSIDTAGGKCYNHCRVISTR